MRKFPFTHAEFSGIRPPLLAKLQMVSAVPYRGVGTASFFFGGTTPMRRLGAFFLLLCMAVPAIAADAPSTEEQPSIPWYRWLFLGERAKPMPPKPVVRQAPITREALARMLADERDVYLKRLEAITKIKQIALDRGDEAMLKKADDLERQAEETFAQRTAKLQEMTTKDDDRASLERRPDERPATADRSTRRPTRGNER